LNALNVIAVPNPACSEAAAGPRCVKFAAVRFTNHVVVHDGNPDGVSVTVFTYAVNTIVCDPVAVGTTVIPLTVCVARCGP
jgi:hypothetical protein